MDIASILAPGRTISSLQASSKKRAIELAAEHIGNHIPALDIGSVYRGLIERERLGSTAIGEGVAIPHCRLADCDKITGSLFVLDEAIDFSAPDDKPVKIMFVLLVPADETSEHLATLAMLAEKFEQADYRDLLSAAQNNQQLFNAATGTESAPNIASSNS